MCCCTIRVLHVLTACAACVAAQCASRRQDQPRQHAPHVRRRCLPPPPSSLRPPPSSLLPPPSFLREEGVKIYVQAMHMIEAAHLLHLAKHVLHCVAAHQARHPQLLTPHSLYAMRSLLSVVYAQFALYAHALYAMRPNWYAGGYRMRCLCMYAHRGLCYPLPVCYVYTYVCRERARGRTYVYTCVCMYAGHAHVDGHACCMLCCRH
jgi:hypothetical protein